LINLLIDLYGYFESTGHSIMIVANEIASFLSDFFHC